MKEQNSVPRYIFSAIFFVLLMTVVVSAAEPQRPKLIAVLSQEKEVKADTVAVLTPEEVFERLKDIDFVIDDDLMHKTIYRAFHNRKTIGIAIALKSLSLPESEVVGGELIDRSQEHYVAKKILQVFPKLATRKLLIMYGKADAVTRGNIIRAAGNLAGGYQIKKLLVSALDDKEVCENEYPEIEGELLRVCDIAYNQLILRYDVKKVLRIIGNVDRIEVRDYHISTLKDQLRERGILPSGKV